MCVHAVNAHSSGPRPTTVPPSPDIDANDPQLALLRVLAENSDLSQRELSRSLGLSLGKTHYVLHALLDKGLVKARNFTRSDNKLGYSYFLTPAGFNEKVRMTREFLARKEQEFEHLRATIASLREEVISQVETPSAGHDGLARAPGPRSNAMRQSQK
jgi:EPS-associated MarR family transcriptional regulator